MASGKVVISGYYGCGNLGDEAILTALLARLRARWSELQLIVLSGDPSETARFYHVQAIDRWNPFRIARELRSADCLISGGGGLIQDSTSHRSALYYLGIIGLAQAWGRPVFLLGQGLGPLRRPWLQRLARRCLRQAAHALVRDEASYQLLQNWGLAHDQLVLGGDLALLLTQNVGARHAVPLPADQSPRPYLVAALKGSQPQQFVRSMAQTLDELASAENLRIVLLALSSRGDGETLAAISRALKSPNLILAPQTSELRETLELIAGARLMLGMRLHALLFSLLTATPFVALSDDPKIDQFVACIERLSDLRLPLWPVKRREDPRLDLRSAYASLTHDRDAKCEALHRAAAQLTTQTEAALQNCFDRMEPLIDLQM